MYQDNGSGILSCVSIPAPLYTLSGARLRFFSTGFNRVASYCIPAGTLGANDVIDAEGSANNTGTTSGFNAEIELGNGTATSSLASCSAAGSACALQLLFSMQNSTALEQGIASARDAAVSTLNGVGYDSLGLTYNTATSPLCIDIQCDNVTGADGCVGDTFQVTRSKP